jgi:hypothetical protein
MKINKEAVELGIIKRMQKNLWGPAGGEKVEWQKSVMYRRDNTVN